MRSKKIYQRWSDEDLRQAYLDVKDPARPHKSVRQAARDHKMSPSTLDRYILAAERDREEQLKTSRKRTTPSDQESEEASLLFSPPRKKMGAQPTLRLSEEASLLDRIVAMADRHAHMTGPSILREANRILESREDKQLRDKGELPKCGPGWLQSFRDRHPEIRLRVPEALGRDRAENTTIEIAEEHFSRLALVIEDLHMVNEPHRIWNADETSVTLGDPSRRRVYARRGARDVCRITPTDTQHITVIFAFNGDGSKYSPPTFLCKNEKKLPNGFVQCMLEEGLDDWGAECTGTGWMTEEAFFKWMHNFVSFLNHVVRSGKENEKHLLILDQHSTHCSFRIIDFAEKNDVVIYFLPPHTTHYLQPADVVLFSPLKRSYRNGIQDECATVEISARDVPHFFKRAMKKSCTKENMCSSFEKAGIFPFNSKVVIDRIRGTSAAGLENGGNATAPDADLQRRTAAQSMDFGVKTAAQLAREEAEKVDKKKVAQARRLAKQKARAAKKAAREAEMERRVRFRRAREAFQSGNMKIVIKLKATAPIGEQK